MPRETHRRPARASRPVSGRVTALDVARRAGVSRSAVSRTMTVGASVSPLTRSKVLTAAAELGYQPNLMARSLMTQRTHLVALVMAQLRNPFFTEMIADFNAEFSRRGYQTMLFALSPEERVEEVVERALPYQPDGVVLVTCSLTPELAERCRARRLPVVVMNRPGDAFAPHVWIRGDAIGDQVAQLLLDEGRRRFVLLEFNQSEPLSGRSRSYIQRLLRASGVDVTVDYGGFDYQSGRAAALRLLRSPTPPDAIFCVNDLVALGALDAARMDLGLQVPRDLSIVGFSDIEQAGWRSHDLTTARIPVDALVQSVVDGMLQRIEEPETALADVLIDCPIMLRGTTLPPGGGRALAGPVDESAPGGN